MCPEGRLKCECDKTVCIWGSKCNRVQECTDGSDEEECTEAGNEWNIHVLYLFCKHMHTKGHKLMYTK